MADESGATRRSLILRVGAGDQDAWRTFVIIYKPKIERWARQWHIRADEIDDVVQEVLLRVAKGASAFSYDMDKGKYRAWLKTIAHNVAMNVLSKNSRQPRTNGQTHDADPMSMVTDDAAGDSLLDNLIEGELEASRFEAEQFVRRQSNEREWQAYHQSVYLQKESLEIAESLGIKIGHYYKCKSDFVARLKEYVKELDE